MICRFPELNVSPFQGKEFAAPEPGSSVQENHHTKTPIKL